jgi:hypothetical protein
MDRWGWEQIEPWLIRQVELPVGALLCVIDGRTGRPARVPSGARMTLRDLAIEAGAGGVSPRISFATRTRWTCRARHGGLRR